MPVRRFENAAFVKDDAAKARQIEVIQLLIIGYVRSWPAFRLRRNDFRSDAELVSFARHLI